MPARRVCDRADQRPNFPTQPWRWWRYQSGWRWFAEIRIDDGPGYRVSLIRLEQVIVLLLCGGDKSAKTPTSSERKALAAMARKTR